MEERCKIENPQLHATSKDHLMACHGVEEGRI